MAIDWLTNLLMPPEQEMTDTLYDKTAYDKWSERMEQGYTDLGEDQKRYRGLADESYGRARGSWQQADKYLGKGAGLYGDSVRDTDKSLQVTDKIRGMASDSSYYQNLRDRLRTQQDKRSGVMTSLGGLRRKLDMPFAGGAASALVMDSFKILKNAQEKIVNKDIAKISRTNPAAAVRLKNKFNTDMITMLGKAQQQGFIADKQTSVNDIATSANLLLSENQLINEAERAIMNEDASRTGQMGALTSVANQYINAGQQRQAAARGYTGIGSMYEGRGAGQWGSGQASDAGASDALMNRLNISGEQMAIQDKFRLTDSNKRQAIQNYNDSRQYQAGQNVMGLFKMGADLWTGGAASNALDAAALANNPSNTTGTEQMNNPDPASFTATGKRLRNRFNEFFPNYRSTYRRTHRTPGNWGSSGLSGGTNWSNRP